MTDFTSVTLIKIINYGLSGYVEAHILLDISHWNEHPKIKNAGYKGI